MSGEPRAKLGEHRRALFRPPLGASRARSVGGSFASGGGTAHPRDGGSCDLVGDTFEEQPCGQAPVSGVIFCGPNPFTGSARIKACLVSYRARRASRWAVYSRRHKGPCSLRISQQAINKKIFSLPMRLCARLALFPDLLGVRNRPKSTRRT